jgi:TDG/mug DNA glycosylase family protein
MDFYRHSSEWLDLLLWRNCWRQAKPPHLRKWISLSRSRQPTSSDPTFVRDRHDDNEESAIHLAKSMIKTTVRSLSGALSRQRLTDHIKPGVRILFVGINPGLRSAAIGHHFAGYSNRFWKLLFESKLVLEPLTHQDDWRLPEWGIGLTNIIQRPSAGIDVLKPREYIAGRKRLIATVKRYRPHIVALLGVTIYRTLFPEYRTVRISLGLQAKTLADCPVFVLPNPSGRNAHYSYETMLTEFRALRKATNRPALR